VKRRFCESDIVASRHHRATPVIDPNGFKPDSVSVGYQPAGGAGGYPLLLLEWKRPVIAGSIAFQRRRSEGSEKGLVFEWAPPGQINLGSIR